MKIKKLHIVNGLKHIIIILVLVVIILPVIYTITGSFISSDEIKQYLYVEKAPFHLIPDKITFSGYYEVFFKETFYLIKFWNSLFFAFTVVFLQIAVSCMAGYSLAKFTYKFKNTIFYSIIIIMLMPLQVTLVPNYIILDNLDLIGNLAAIILPAIFWPFGVFLLRQFMVSIPKDIIEAAKIDGCNELLIFCRIIIPLSKSGIITLMILGFIDVWNMVEQPLIFLKDVNKYPLSIYLSQINFDNLTLGFTCGILSMIPAFLLYICFNQELVEGISYTNLK